MQKLSHQTKIWVLVQLKGLEFVANETFTTFFVCLLKEFVVIVFLKFPQEISAVLSAL